MSFQASHSWQIACDISVCGVCVYTFSISLCVLYLLRTSTLRVVNVCVCVCSCCGTVSPFVKYNYNYNITAKHFSEFAVQCGFWIHFLRVLWGKNICRHRIRFKARNMMRSIVLHENFRLNTKWDIIPKLVRFQTLLNARLVQRSMTPQLKLKP